MAVKKAMKKPPPPAKKEDKSAQESAISRREPARLSNPFAAMRRLSDEMERLFHGGGVGDFRFPRLWRDVELPEVWDPGVDMFERKGQLVIRADLPGLAKEDVRVEITDSDVTIEGERKSEKEEEHEGYYQSERSYGSFWRTIGLPEGVKTERARAAFKDGVLEITMPTAIKTKKAGRRLSIKT
jgi:HSP20 family protein